MGELVTLLGQHLVGQPPTLVIRATLVWEAALAHVNLLGCGLGVHLHVKVEYLYVHAYFCSQSANMCACTEQ